MFEPRALAFLLDDLCVKYGYCLPPQSRERLEAEPPPTPEAFATAVFRAEGLDPFVDEQLYRQLLAFVTHAFENRRVRLLEIEIAVAHPVEYPALTKLYRSWGYNGEIGNDDRVYVATHQGCPIGLVRRTDDQGILMLRGMQVDPNFQRQRVGTRLLRAFVAELPTRECYCIPFSHLVEFYGEEGFEHYDESAAPAFLRERLVQYRAKGYDVVLMRRPNRGSSLST